MPPTGLEPATLGLKVRCSSRLSYEGFLVLKRDSNSCITVCLHYA